MLVECSSSGVRRHGLGGRRAGVVSTHLQTPIPQTDDKKTVDSVAMVWVVPCVNTTCSQ